MAASLPRRSARPGCDRRDGLTQDVAGSAGRTDSARRQRRQSPPPNSRTGAPRHRPAADRPRARRMVSNGRSVRPPSRLNSVRTSCAPRRWAACSPARTTSVTPAPERCVAPHRGNRRVERRAGLAHRPRARARSCGASASASSAVLSAICSPVARCVDPLAQRIRHDAPPISTAAPPPLLARPLRDRRCRHCAAAASSRRR